jgi:hypothetical protein
MKFLVIGVSMFNSFILTSTEHERHLTFAVNTVINHLLTNTII